MRIDVRAIYPIVGRPLFDFKPIDDLVPRHENSLIPRLAIVAMKCPGFDGHLQAMIGVDLKRRKAEGK